ncbi:hypothetical protein AB0A73_13185 [Glycomyces sp. NPDC047369]
MIISDQRPGGADWISRRLTDLERQVRELQAGRRLEAATIGAGGLTVKGTGGITVEGGGDLNVKGGELRVGDEDGQTQVYVGPLTYGGVPAGTGWTFRRFNGQPVFTLEGSDPEHQFLAVRDAQGNIVFGDDTVSGQGLARPWLPVPWSGADYTQWPGTTSASFTSVLETTIPRQQPKLYVRIRHTADASGTTGELRLMFGGTQLGATVSVGFTVSYAELTVDLPPGTFGETMNLAVEGRRTAGTGAVRATVTASWTQQS